MGTAEYRTTIWALSDQAVVSGGNFLTNLVLIRALAPPSYGAYALVLNAVLFANTLQSNMVVYPVCMLGARSTDEELAGIATGGLLATTIGTAVNSIVIAGACLYLRRPSLIAIVVAATLFWQLQETLRIVFVSRLAYKRALTGDAVSYLGQALVLALICKYHVPSLFEVFAVVLGTSLVSGLGQGLQIRPRLVSRATLNVFFSELWRFGRWSTLARLVAFFTSYALPWLLAYTSGLPAVAAFQSLLQLVGLANPLMFGFNALITSSIAGQRRVKGGSSWSSSVKQMRLAAVLLSSYFVALALFGRFFMMILYGKRSPYLVNSSSIRYFAIAYALEALAMIAGAILGGLGETRSNFIVQSSAMLTSVLFVFPWVLRSGLKAAVIGLIAIGGTRAAAAWYLALRALEREPPVGAQEAIVMTGT
jgi:O-antigen/teichoic acid export membrane protein